ncbi:D-alanyl-D-alanine carboxypeptidase/D-alanyl-D-alanine endopeptidase [Virgibacillus sediminis]|uniref:D-alanyl-D-alanine carboxypeptidase/D-alanyl-D-alanine-endopeptidase n=1 Tax=Virgibacillus sediminis TaxID=202260 RepID=A0ABV7A357_9BACI
MVEKQLKKFLKSDPRLKGALVGVSIRSAKTGEKLFAHMGDIRFRPASNLKLLTSAAALTVLGAGYTFSTDLGTDGRVEGKTLTGNLFLRGKGDPTLMPADLRRFAEKLRENGVERIEGDVIGDDTWHDDVRLSPDLNWSDEQYYYGAQVSALTVAPDEDYDAGSLIVEVEPGMAVGDRPEIRIFPETDYVRVINEARTVSGEEESEVIVERKHAENTIVVQGTISLGGEKEKEWMSVWDPTRYAVHLFSQALKEQGISWHGDLNIGKAPEDMTVLYTDRSIPLAELLVPFMKFSNNGHGEIMVKEMGKIAYGEGSWERGLEVLKSELPKLGVKQSTISIRDGSGLSHFNLIPANEITQLLYEVQKEEWFPAFFHSLPIAGHEERRIGGTLRDRMKGLSVQAKTGTIHGVSTLSGYMDDPAGERVIFSIMINNLLDEEEGKSIEDDLLDIMTKSRWDQQADSTSLNILD